MASFQLSIPPLGVPPSQRVAEPETVKPAVHTLEVKSLPETPSIDELIRAFTASEIAEVEKTGGMRQKTENLNSFIVERVARKSEFFLVVLPEAARNNSIIEVGDIKCVNITFCGFVHNLSGDPVGYSQQLAYDRASGTTKFLVALDPELLKAAA